jgi:CysZ protein
MQALKGRSPNPTAVKSYHGLLKGGVYLWEGLRLIRQPGLRMFVVIPLILNVIVFGLMINWIAGVYGSWVSHLMSGLPHWLGFLSYLFWVIYGLFIIILVVWCFSAVANLIGAPFYSYLSERVENQLLGQKKTEETISLKAFLMIIPRTLIREFKKLAYYLPRAVVLLILGFIPGLNLFAAIAWFIFSAWMMSIQYMDYPADNRGESLDKLKSTVRAHCVTSLVFGGWVGFGMMLPLVNLIIVPAAVCGATKFWLDTQSK